MIPDEINEYTQEYRETGNHFRDFVNEQFEEVQDDKGGVRLLQAYDAYRQWYQAQKGDKNWKKRKEFQAFMDDKYKTKSITGSKEKCYLGIKLVSMESSHLGGGYSFVPNPTCEIDDLDM